MVRRRTPGRWERGGAVGSGRVAAALVRGCIGRKYHFHR